MSIFKFPKSLCKEIESQVTQFWWGQGDNEYKIHWKSWKHISTSKKNGGLGFRSLKEFNKALLAKQVWRLLKNPNSLWATILKARYFPNSSSLEATTGGNASWGWLSLLEGPEVIKIGCC